jgi:hypothetical protein
MNGSRCGNRRSVHALQHEGRSDSTKKQNTATNRCPALSSSFDCQLFFKLEDRLHPAFLAFVRVNPVAMITGGQPCITINLEVQPVAMITGVC